MISDIEPPVFAKSNECKRGIFVSKQTLPGKKYAEVYFESIDIHDNSGDQPTVKCSYRNNQPCNYELGKSYSIEITSGFDILFEATDSAGNFNTCRFYVIVQGMFLSLKAFYKCFILIIPILNTKSSHRHFTALQKQFTIP